MYSAEDQLVSQTWGRYPLGGLPGVASVTYGVVRPGPHHPGGVPLLQAGDIVDGVLDQGEPRMIDTAVHDRHQRTSLVPGDLVVVLVGRIGDTAVVGPAQYGWNVARSVGVVRFTGAGQDHGISTWLHWWMKTPEARALCAEGSAGSAHSTLSISSLAQLPVPLPPLDVRMHLLHTMRLVEQRIAQNTRIAACAMDLADAHFAGFVQECEDATGWDRALADVGVVMGGMRRSDVTEDVDDGVAAAWVAPAEVLQHRLAHLDRTDQTTWAPSWAVCPPGSLLVAPRPGGVETVVSRIPVVPGRGMLAICTAGEMDRMWLLHELRSRSKELVATAQGQQGREMSRKALSRLTLSWPDASGVREPFARIAVPLHERAEAALGENRALEKLITSLLTETAEKADGRG